MTDGAALAGLFLSALLAATLIPGSSEAALIALLQMDKWPVALLVLTATAGNVLGSVVNWLCGRFLAAFRDRAWFPISPAHYDKAIGWYRRYGRWSLLLAWVPIVGDPLTVAAGALRSSLAWFAVLVTIGKLGRYLVIAAAAAP
ncbi:MAG: DedA family protein [Alphaproteobacteria bacterium]|nr:DedA family protein [Alphaproteobacteria bacterium]